MIEGTPDRLSGPLVRCGVADVGLSTDELTEIDEAASRIQVEGGRYSDEAERMTNL